MGRNASPWVILRVTPRQEAFVVGALREFLIPGYAPMHITPAKHAKREGAKHVRALIPGYVFAQLADDIQLDLARAIRGVREIMCRDGKPLRVRPLDIGGLVLAEASHKFDETWTPPKPKGQRYSHRWKRGDRVKISGGSFDGFVGEVVKAKGRRRMEVLLTLFGRVQEVNVEHRQLSLAQDVALSRAA